MVEKHCVECGTEARPKLYHPSSLRAEVTVWFVAILIGAGAGVVSIFTTPTETPDSPELQRFAMSIMQPSEGPSEPVTRQGPMGSENSMTRVAVWARDVVLDFVRSAWWVLPFPILFSLWRQFSTREGCIECRSRQLVEVESPPFPM